MIRVQAAAEALGLDIEVRERPAAKSLTEAAAVLGIRPADIVKTLVVQRRPSTGSGSGETGSGTGEPGSGTGEPGSGSGEPGSLAAVSSSASPVFTVRIASLRVIPVRLRMNSTVEW